MTSLTACGTLTGLLGVSKKHPGYAKCEEEGLMKECEFSDFSQLLDIPKIPSDLGGAIGRTCKLESNRCALIHKQLIECIKDQK